MWTIIGHTTIEQSAFERREREAQAAAHRQPAPTPLTPPARGSLRQQVSVWCGYRMISLGSRLLRPALIPGA